MKRERCQITYCTNNKTKNICDTYNKRVCDTCSAKIILTCKKCLNFMHNYLKNCYCYYIII